MGKTKWRTEPTSVAIAGDEVWIAVKFQSNSEIAGSPRNSFRASVVNKFAAGRALTGLGGDKLTEPYQTANGGQTLCGSQTARDKFRRREGNNPDLQLRSLIYAKWKTRWSCENNRDVGLEAAIH